MFVLPNAGVTGSGRDAQLLMWAQTQVLWLADQVTLLTEPCPHSPTSPPDTLSMQDSGSSEPLQEGHMTVWPEKVRPGSREPPEG